MLGRSRIYSLSTSKISLDRVLSQFKKSSPGPHGSSDLRLYKGFVDIELIDVARQLQELPSYGINKTLKQLEENGLNLNIGSVDLNNTILHAACSLSMGHNIVRELLKFHVDVNIKNSELELPIHTAIKHDNPKCIEELINYDRSLIYATDNKNGFALIHKASDHLAIESIQLIISLDPSCVDTFPRHSSYKSESVIHIAIKSYQGRVPSVLNQWQDDDHNHITSLNSYDRLLDIEAGSKTNNEKLIHKVTTLFLERCSRDTLVRNKQSAIHYLIETGDTGGLKLIFEKFETDKVFLCDFVNLPHQQTGRSSLLAAIDKNMFDIALLLVDDFGAVLKVSHKIGEVSEETMALGRAIQRCPEPKDVAPLLKSLIKHEAKFEPLLEAVIDRGDITLARALFDEMSDPRLYINYAHSSSGKTVLHTCLASSTLEQEVDDIFYLLDKGCNVMHHCSSSNELPIHFAVQYSFENRDNFRVTNYFSALKRYGIKSTFEQLSSLAEKCEFLQEHILPAAYHADYIAVDTLLALLFSLNAPVAWNEIIHRRVPNSPYEMYKYPILHWATFHSNTNLMSRIVQAEYKVHENEKQFGFECFRSLGNNRLKQQAIASYNDWFHKSSQPCSKILPTLWEVWVMLYLVFILDICFDTDLVKTYYQISAQIQNGNVSYYEEFKIYNGTSTLCSLMAIKNRYYFGAILSISLILPSILAFLFMSYFRYSLEDDLKDLERQYSCFSFQFWRWILLPFKPIIFVFSHSIRTRQAKEHPYEPNYKQKYDIGRSAWNVVRRVEVGIESVGQLIVQLYLLSPLAEHFAHSTATQVSKHVWNGLGYYATLTLLLDASFEEKMLAKFFISSIHICATITILRLSKNSATGPGRCDAVICFFLICLSQLISRSMTITLLFISNVPGQYIFFLLLGHWTLTIIMKFTLEVSPKREYSDLVANLEGKIRALFNILTTTMCSTIVYMPMVKSENPNSFRDPNADNTLFPTLAYFILLLIEHIALIGATIQNSEILGNYKYYLWFVPLGLWLLSLILSAIYYKLLHRSTEMGKIGPKQRNCTLECHGVFCRNIKKCSINLSTCCCSIKTVDQSDECELMSITHTNNY